MTKNVHRLRLKGSKKPSALVVVRFECEVEDRNTARSWFARFLQLVADILFASSFSLIRWLLKLCRLLLACCTEILMFFPNIIDRIVFDESIEDSAYPTYHYEQSTNEHATIEHKNTEDTTYASENEEWVCSKCRMSKATERNEQNDSVSVTQDDYYEGTETTVVTTTNTDWAETINNDNHNEASSSDETIATSDEYEKDWCEYYSDHKKVWLSPVLYKFKKNTWNLNEVSVDDNQNKTKRDTDVGSEKTHCPSSALDCNCNTDDCDFESIRVISDAETVSSPEKCSTLVLQIPDHIMARLHKKRFSPPTTPDVDYSDSEDEASVQEKASELPAQYYNESYIMAVQNDGASESLSERVWTQSNDEKSPRASIMTEKYIEPILNASKNEERFVLFPVKHPDIYDMYKRQVAQFWTMEEIDLSKDPADWNDRLSAHERDFFKCILAFFAPSDGIVGENLVTRFYDTVVYTEARYFYAFQAAMENIHAEVYSQLIKTLIPNEEEQQAIFSSFMSTPGIMEKTRWAKQWLEHDNISFVERLVAFAVVEGLLFSGSFASIFWLKKRGLMQGLTFSNELISRDEGLHCDFACLLYTKHIVHKLPNNIVYNIVREAVHAESVFFSHALQDGPVGELSQRNMMQYVRFCADRLLIALEVPPLYSATNPFDFMHMISLDGRTNFFERRVGEYRQSRVLTQRDGDTVNASDNQFSLDYSF